MLLMDPLYRYLLFIMEVLKGWFMILLVRYVKMGHQVTIIAGPNSTVP